MKRATESNSFAPRTTVQLVIAFLVAILGLIHGLYPSKFDLITVAYLVVAIGVFFLNEFAKITISEKGISLERAAREAAAKLGVGAKGLEADEKIELPPELASDAVLDPEDPNKGRFGGRPDSNGKRIAATVNPVPNHTEWFLVHLVVESIDQRTPLTGDVTFYLHPSFARRQIRVATVGGKAILETTAYGAFTVGAICEQDQTRLELDLAELPTAPEGFRLR